MPGSLIVFIFKCLISGAVLGFCMFMLIRKSTDGFYISTISLILGGVMGSQNSTADNNSKNKPFANPDNAKNIPDEIKDIRGKIYEGNLVSTNDNNLTSSKNKTITLQGLETPTTVNQSGRKFIIQTPENKAIIAEFKEAKTS